jgi:transposase
MELTDIQWEKIEPIILQSTCNKDPRGRKPRDPREVLNGILWVLRTGIPWKNLPDKYPPYQTCHRRFQQWTKDGVFRRIIEHLVAELEAQDGINIREAFMDGRFVSTKKGVMPSTEQNGKNIEESWPLQMLPVFLSPPALQALRLMK